MVNHYLLTLMPDEEDRVLTSVMRPGSYAAQPDIGPCLVGVATDGVHRCLNSWRSAMRGPDGFLLAEPTVEGQYDRLCKRFGTERVNAAIRNRILSNRARRTLRVRELVG